MKDSRTISKFMKSNEKGTYSVEFLDWTKLNQFVIRENGKIESTVYGAASSILLRVAAFSNGQYSAIDCNVHPNRILAIAELLLNGNTDLLKSSTEGDLIGIVNKKLIKTEKKDSKFKAVYTNIYMTVDDAGQSNLIFFNKQGYADADKSDTNTYSFDLSTFEKEKSIGISVPLFEAITIFSQLKRYLENLENVFFPNMLKGRHIYEENCKTIFKNCKGDAKRIKEIEEKMLKNKIKNSISSNDDEIV